MEQIGKQDEISMVSLLYDCGRKTKHHNQMLLMARATTNMEAIVEEAYEVKRK